MNRSPRAAANSARLSLNPLGGSVTRPIVWSSRISSAASTKPDEVS